MPYYHQGLLAAWIASLRANDGQWRYYDQYTFSSLRGRASPLKNGLRYQHDHVRLALSAPDEAFVNFLVEQIFGQPIWEVGTLSLEPFQATPQAPPAEFGGEVNYLCIAPLVPTFMMLQDEEVGQQLISPEQDLFSDWLYECTMTRMEQSGRYTSADLSSFFKFQLVPDHTYLQRLKRQGKQFARNYPVTYRDKDYEVRGYVFPFTLHAHPEVQAYVYTRGLGAFTEQGLGMVDFS